MALFKAAQLSYQKQHRSEAPKNKAEQRMIGDRNMFFNGHSSNPTRNLCDCGPNTL